MMLARVEGLIPMATLHGWTGHSRREKLYYTLDKRLLTTFPRLIAVSDQIRGELLRAGVRPERVRTILNGIDPWIFQRNRARELPVRKDLGFRPDDIVIGAVGRLEIQKRYDILLEAFAQVRRGRRDLRLVIAGAGNCRSDLERSTRRLGLAGDCRFLGHRTDVADLHHAFDVFVQSADYEGTSNAVLEAMAMETPVIATAVGGTGELIKDGIHGLLVPSNSPGALARAIDHVFSDPSAARCRALAARRRVERELSFGARLRKVEGLYEKLMIGRLRAGWGRRRS